MRIRQAGRVEDRDLQRSPVELMLGSLPAQHREIIVATYFRRRTTEEAARLLGLDPDTARARLYQAMRDLSFMVAIGWPDPAAPVTPRAGAHGVDGFHRRGMTRKSPATPDW